MALNFPDVGENLALEAVVGKTNATALTVRLYKSNTTPSDSDTAATYTESTFTGYSAATLTAGTWGVAVVVLLHMVHNLRIHALVLRLNRYMVIT